MAMSLSHPDPASPASVADASFGTARRGFDQGQVRDFLRMVAAELGRLQERERFLERELRIAQSNPDLDAATLDDAALTRLLGEETARVLSTARESAREIREKAEESAARMLTEASDEVARIREQADLDAARVRADAASDAESEIEMAKQQGREMVTEARAYRERVLSELARRRELAREQIEQLIHGRDRLIQAFERARLAAVDVVGELEPLGEPSEYVNLTPTTGPVPVMVPNARPDPEPTAALPRTLDPAADEESGAGDVAADHADVEVAADEESGAEVADAEVSDVEGADAEMDDAEADESTFVGGDLTERADDVAAPATDADDQAGTVSDEDALEEAIRSETGFGTEHSETDGADVDASQEAEPAYAHAPVGDDHPAEDGMDRAATDAAGEGDGSDVMTGATAADGSDDIATGAVVDDDMAADASAPAADDEARDDVVVDLFARLRAATPDHATDDTDDTDDQAAGADTRPDSGTDGAAATSTMVGDLDDAEAADASDDHDDDSPFRRRDAALTPLIVASARKLKRVLADEQNGVLEVLRRDRDVMALDELVPARDEQMARYVDAVEGDLAEAAAAGGRALLGDDAHLDVDEVAAAHAAAAAIVGDWLVGPLRERLERCVDEGDGDNLAISRRVRSVYREWKTQHIDEQLDDVLRAAYGRGALAAVDSSTALLWLVDEEHPACPDCDDNSLSPPVAAGEPFPTGHTFAPAHPGCRCLVAVADR